MDQPFYIKCKCGYFRRSTGLTADLQDLHEYKKCATCGGPRTYRCPKCGKLVKMTREKGTRGK